MAIQLFKVTDAKDGSHTIVQARTKSRAAKHVAGSRFTAEKASPSDITAFVNAGNKFDVADAEGTDAPAAAPAETAPAAEVVQAE